MIKVIKFSATWCGPCKALNPIWAEVVKNTPNVEFLSADVDESPEMVKEYMVRSVPAIIYIKDGVEVTRSTGLVTKERILKDLALCN